MRVMKIQCVLGESDGGSWKSRLNQTVRDFKGRLELLALSCGRKWRSEIQRTGQQK